MNRISYDYQEYDLERNDVALYLSCTKIKDSQPEDNILLIHGVTYSSHEFAVDYLDYSLVKRLADDGYGVWLMDIAGFGRSQALDDGFRPDSDYAAKDIAAGVERICELTEQDKINLLGWSWGTLTSSRFAADHPERLNKLILYAPIISGLGQAEVNEAFHHNSWEHAAEDFQRDPDGSINYELVEPLVVELLCSNCWHYDGEYSPNGGRKDLLVARDQILIDLDKITVPTLIIYGDRDPYLNYDLIDKALEQLPSGSRKEMITGASHVAILEKPYYKDFQNRILRFLHD